MSILTSRRHLSAALISLAVSACGTLPPVQPGPTTGNVVARNRDFVVVVAQAGDSLASLARNYLGDARRAWWIAEFNNVSRVRAGDELAIPLKWRNAIGVYAHGYQTVPILCYHRFSPSRTKLAVTPAAFAAQMAYLAANDYHVISLAELQDFLRGHRPLPRRSVVITIDDGYRSTYQVAFPVLRKHGFPATVFLYSDFVASADALTWPQMLEMKKSGLIDIQPHSKSHANLVLRLPQETDGQYRQRIRKEMEIPSDVIERRLGDEVFGFAYPYGDTNDEVVEELQRNGFALGLTVTPGGNGFFADPYMLRRTMIFGDDDIAAFAAKLVVFHKSKTR